MVKKLRIRRSKKRPKARKVPLEELEQILERVEGVLSKQEHETLKDAVQTLAFLTRELEAKGASLQRMRHFIFGPSTEKTQKVLGETSKPTKAGVLKPAPANAAVTAPQDEASTTEAAGAKQPGFDEPENKRPGHGRNAAADYVGATKVVVSHQSFEHKEHCPGCEKGKLYHQKDPARLLRVVGMAPLSATVYELERLRCNLCGELYTADSPKGVGDEKYDETAAAMMALLKYGCGTPFHRLDWLQKSLGIPLPATTQWEVVDRAARLLEPVYAELVRQAAQGQLLYTDDTTMKILGLSQPEQAQAEGKKAKGRKGTFTTGIVSSCEGQQCVLFFTGRKHAGENLTELLAQRAAELAPPIQMCDALPANTAGEFETIVAFCLAHARRRFVAVAHNFPKPCRYVLEALGKVYGYDKEAQDEQMTPEQRLRWHQTHSGPVMEQLASWLERQLEQKKVEPNSGLGQAIRYMQKHWSKLTLFLQKVGAPLDNNTVERALKKAILHRKNSMFYKTENGARVGDLFMSLIHTAERAGQNPFEYLVALQRHAQKVLATPASWMPWTYQDAIKRLGPSPGVVP